MNINYPSEANATTKAFIDKLNKVINTFGASTIQDYCLINNGVQHTIYKLALPNFIVATFECFNDDGSGLFNTEQHYDKVKFIKYDKKMNPGKSLILPFNGNTTIELGMNILG